GCTVQNRRRTECVPFDDGVAHDADGSSEEIQHLIVTNATTLDCRRIKEPVWRRNSEISAVKVVMSDRHSASDDTDPCARAALQSVSIARLGLEPVVRYLSSVHWRDPYGARPILEEVSYDMPSHEPLGCRGRTVRDEVDAGIQIGRACRRAG